MKFQSMKLRFTASIVFAYIVIALLTYFAFHLVTSKVVAKLASDLALQQVELVKLKLISSLQHDLSLSLRMAESPLLKQWALDEDNPALKKRALSELESYRAGFKGRSVTFIPTGSGHNYFLDDQQSAEQPRYTIDPKKPSDGWYFRVLREVDQFELNLDRDEHLEMTKIWFNVVVKGANDRKIAVCGSSTDIGPFLGELLQPNDKGLETVLFGRDGAIVGHRDRNYLLRNSRAHAGDQKTTVFDLLAGDADRAALKGQLAALIKGAGDGATLQLAIGGKRHLAAVSYLKEIQWFSLVLVDTDQVVGSRDFLPIIATTIVSLLAVIVIIGLLLNQIVLAPISRLAASARQLARGDFDVVLPVGSDDEIGALTRCFNEMVLMVKDHTQNLEQNVSERTRQFADIHEELLSANEELHARRSEAEATLEALQRSEEQLRLLLDSTAEAIYGTDLQGKCTFCNSACLRLLGYGTPEELVGVDMTWQIHHLLPGEDDLFQAGSKGERVHLEDHLLWRPDGSFLQVEFWSYPQYRNGRIVGTVATFLDVTERVRSQEKLLKLSRAVENSPATVVITDRYGSIEYVNPKFTEIAGFLPEEAIGQNPRILSAGVQSKEFYRELWMTITAGQEWRGEFCNRKKNGEIHWEHASISPIRDEKGTITHFVAVKEDVTERKRVAEELQKAKDAADAANSHKSEFLANMSHEIRTPLNAIIGFSELALSGDLGRRHEEYAGKIYSAGKNLLGIVNDILDFSKVEAGKLKMEQTAFTLERAVADVLAVVQQKAQEKGLRLAVELPPELGGQLIGDPLRLGQVVINLLSNAIKFTEKGEVRLSVGLKEQTVDRVALSFCVSDTGIGLSADTLARLFQPFTQADGSTTRRFGGTGLGLSISKQLVELMGGEIWATSEPGQGSRFCFTAWFGIGMAAEAEAASAAADREPPPDLTGRRLLLVEDNEVNRQLAIILLKGAGASVQVAVNGREAVEKVLAGGVPFDLVLMDIQMPDMDGYRATRLIRSDERFALLPIIAMTAHAMAAERLKILDAGMNDQVTKPIDSRLLFATLGRHLRQPAAAKPFSPEEGPRALEVIPRIAGLDMDGALARLDGKRSLYLWLLSAFLESEADTALALAKALDEGDRALAERLAHTTRGNAGNIGAIGVMAVAARLEHAIREEEAEQAVRDALGSLRIELAELLGELREALPAAADETLPQRPDEPWEIHRIESVLARLLRHIEESDGAAADWLERHADGLAGLPGEELARLKGHLGVFDYDAARDALAALSAKAGLSLYAPDEERFATIIN
jgi:PAS domain S-box-containing protein